MTVLNPQQALIAACAPKLSKSRREDIVMDIEAMRAMEDTSGTADGIQFLLDYHDRVHEALERMKP